EGATRLANENGEGGDVQDVDVGFDHDIEGPARQQVIVHEVAVAADAADALDERAERAPLRPRGEALEVTAGDVGLLQLRDSAHPHRAIVEERPGATLRPRDLIVGRSA